MVIEVDGGQHAVEKEKDRERDNYLQRHGFKVLRFWNNDVLQNIKGVLEVIREKCLSHPPLTPPVISKTDLPPGEGIYIDIPSHLTGEYTSLIPSHLTGEG